MERPGRNDRCHCGSDKKYKKCHFAADQEALYGKRRQEDAERAKTEQPIRSGAPMQCPHCQVALEEMELEEGDETDEENVLEWSCPKCSCFFRWRRGRLEHADE